MDRAVVVGTDGSQAATAALTWAADDAERRRRPLRIVHVREPWAAEHSLNAASGAATLTQRGGTLLRKAAAQARALAPAVTVSTAPVTGAVAERLRSEAETADTLVAGSRGLGGITGAVVGSVGLGLTGRTACPLVVVRALGRGDDIVVGDDGSPHAEMALEYALEQATVRGARLRVIHAEPYPLPSEETDGLRRRLASWKEKYPQVEIVEETVRQHSIPALVKASMTAGLVVVGSRGLGRFGSAGLGSVTYGILHRAHCPVAVLCGPWQRT